MLLFTRPLLRDRGMAGDHGVPEAGQLPRVWTRGGRETVAGQCRMRSEVSIGAAGRILDSANPREIRTYKKAVSVAA